MEKFVVGIVAVLCLHVGFVLYVGDDHSGEVARLGARDVSEASPIFVYPPRSANEIAGDNSTIMIAHGGEPEIAFDETAEISDDALPQEFIAANLSRPRDLRIGERKTFNAAPRAVKALRSSSRGTGETLYQNASYTVTRAEFRPGRSAFTPPVFVDIRSELMASSKKNKHGNRRSLLSKMSPVVKKPYDLLKAVGSWIR